MSLTLLDRLACWWLDYRQDRRVRAMKRDQPELFGEPQLKHLRVGDDGYDLAIAHPGVYMMADEFAAYLEANNAKNYVQFDMMPRLDRGSRPVRVTVQWANGESPAAKNARLERELELARATARQ